MQPYYPNPAAVAGVKRPAPEELPDEDLRRRRTLPVPRGMESWFDPIPKRSIPYLHPEYDYEYKGDHDIEPETTKPDVNPDEQNLSPFFQLPPETRNMIYEYVFSSVDHLHDAKVHMDMYDRRDRNGPQSVSRLLTNLQPLRTYRKLYEEARYLAYDLTTFVVLNKDWKPRNPDDYHPIHVPNIALTKVALYEHLHWSHVNATPELLVDWFLTTIDDALRVLAPHKESLREITLLLEMESENDQPGTCPWPIGTLLRVWGPKTATIFARAEHERSSNPHKGLSVGFLPCECTRHWYGTCHYLIVRGKEEGKPEITLIRVRCKRLGFQDAEGECEFFNGRTERPEEKAKYIGVIYPTGWVEEPGSDSD